MFKTENAKQKKIYKHSNTHMSNHIKSLSSKAIVDGANLTVFLKRPNSKPQINV